MAQLRVPANLEDMGEEREGPQLARATAHRQLQDQKAAQILKPKVRGPKIG